jgi:YidC/Oxa1 family membrane protein insertase
VWNSLIVQPISWLLRTLYELTSSYGLAIILFTLIMKFVFLPLTMKGKKSMLVMQRLNPKLKELEAKYKNDKEKYNIELQKLYKQEKANPLSGCLWQLIPFPIMIALFDVVRRPLTNLMGLSAEQIDLIISNATISEALIAKGVDIATVAKQSQIVLANAIHENFDALLRALPELGSTLIDIDFTFLGINLSLTPSAGILNIYWFIPIISGVLSWLGVFINQKLTQGLGGTADQNPQQQNKMMTMMGPVMSIWFGFMWPVTISIYWISNSLFGVAQDVLLNLYYGKKLGIADELKSRKGIEAKKAEAKERAALKADNQEDEKDTRSNLSNVSRKKYERLKKQQQEQRRRMSGPDADEVTEEADSGETDDAKGANSDD